jgi:hypothetical protein
MWGASSPCDKMDHEQMTTDSKSQAPAPATPAESAPAKVLTPAAQRALAEAEERRRRGAEAEAARPKEINGREGPDPVRYGDWEIKGIACDF